MCEGFNVNCEPHSYGSTLSQAAHLHVMLAIRNCDFFELPVPVGIFDVGMKDTIRIADDGCVHAPTKTGLGYDIDWDAVDNLTVKEI
jgi:L-alanine-DL-glutamate epimerase-like enolase superfamily enzyme